MDVLDEELLRFWAALQRNKVRYIMVGGFATRFHGYNRTTDDLDIWLEDTVPNRKNLRQSFSELGYGNFPLIETMEFVPGWTSFFVGNAIELDIMTTMKGIEDRTFEECLSLASVAVINDINIPFLHINQLIDNKIAVNRPKDQADVIELEKIRSLRNKT